MISEHILIVTKDPGYAGYLKMAQVGIPVMAIRLQKMILEGPLPSWGSDTSVPNSKGEKNTKESWDSESSFSD